MIVSIDYEKITEIFSRAEADGRGSLFEYETYELLRRSGAESIPVSNFLLKGTRPSNEELNSLPGEKAVLKIVSPTIIHKTEVGGVKIIEKQPGKIRSSWRKMMDEVPERYALWIDNNRSSAPAVYQELTGDDLIAAIAEDVKGVLMCEFMPPDSSAFGNELILSIRRTREFGMVVTAGLGGTDTELYAQRFRKGEAVVSASAEMIDGPGFLKLFKGTIAYEKLSGKSRGQSRIVSDDQLLECFTSFIDMARFYSPLNPSAGFVIDELEINPFAFTDYQMVPLDGMCRFSKPGRIPIPRPVKKIDNLLHPKTIAIIGVSSTRMNFGRIILKNILSGGFDRSAITIIRPNGGEIDGVNCVDSLADLPQKADLFVVAINAAQVPDLMDEIIDLDCANSVMLIPGGLGEKKGSEERARLIKEKINAAHLTEDGGPVFLGGNCMGVVSHPGSYDTIFIPEEKLPKQRGNHLRKAAFISQSGAFIITRTSKVPAFDPAYILSIGNQNDLTAGDLVSHIKDLDDIDVLAIYMEGFNDLDGLALCRAIRGAVDQGKEVIFYKAGRTPEGKSATSGHTASVAGDYMVCESCIHQAGAMVADNFTQFEDLFTLAVSMHEKKINGNRLAAVSGAGFEAVGMADNILGDDYEMEMAGFNDATVERLETLIRENRLDSLVDVKNPIDINPSANDQLHVDVVEAIAQDPGVDGIVVGLDPLSPQISSLPEGMREGESLTADSGIATLLPIAVAKSDKPILGVVDGGRLYDPMVDLLEKGGVPVFRSSDRAVAALAKYTSYRLHVRAIRNRD
jgi:acyl-CoA synthetase (NDP forming)